MSQEVATHLGARLRRLRLDRGLTQAELAAPRFTAAYISTIEAGRRRPSGAALEHFAFRLGVAPDELASGLPAGAREALRLALQDARMKVASGELDEAVEAARAVAATARAQEWQRELGTATLIEALVAEQRGDLEAAVALFTTAEELATGVARVHGADALAGRTRCLQVMGDIRYAIHLLETYLRVLDDEGIEDPGARARTFASLVAAYFDAGLQRQAEEAADEVYRLFPLVTDADRLANMHINTARVLLEQGRFEEVRASLQRAEDLYVGLQWRNDLGRVHMARGVTLVRAGVVEDGISELEYAIATFAETGHVVNHARATIQLAAAHRSSGRTAQAKMILQGARMGAAGGALQEGLGTREYARCCVADGEPDVAFDFLQKALDLFERADDARELATTYRLLGDVLRATDDIVAACDAYRHAAVALERVA